MKLRIFLLFMISLTVWGVAYGVGGDEEEPIIFRGARPVVHDMGRSDDPQDPPALKEAEDLYRQGLALFKAGKIPEGRLKLERAFGLGVSQIDDDRLSAAIQGDFTNMLDKIRHWNGDDAEADPPSGLEVSEEALQATAISTSPVRAKAVEPIRIDPNNPITQKFIQIYAKGRPGTVEQALARSGRYRSMIEAALQRAGLPRELFYLVMTESEYHATAVSHSGAAGLWQLMPSTARKYGLEVSYWVDERFLPEKATEAAVRYLSDLRDWFGDWELTLAAYNRGENGLGRDMRFARSLDFTSLAGRNALPNETHHYVPKFMACALIGKNPEQYGLHPKYEEPLAYDEVTLQRDLDLGVAARCAKTNEETLRRLNPQLHAWCTPKNRSGFVLRIPKGSKDAFLADLAEVKDWNPGPTLVRYHVQRGDNLGKIARRYRTTVKSLIALNNLRRARLIRPGMVLKIRPGRSRA